MRHETSVATAATDGRGRYASRMDGNDIETKAIELWVAAADAAVKGGEQPPVGGWDAEASDVKQHYRVLAGAMERACLRDSGSASMGRSSMYRSA